MRLKNLWLLLTGLILSTVILSTGNAAYKNKINYQLINGTNFTNIQKQAAEDNKPATLTASGSNDSTKSTSTIKTSTPSVPQETHQENDNEPKQESVSQSIIQSPTPIPTFYPTPTGTQSIPELKQTQTITQTVELSIQSLGIYPVECKEGDTAWDVMKRAAAENYFPMSYQIYDFGIYVSKIGDLESHGNYYWALYYNDQYSMVGVSDLKIKPNDKISWEFETW